MFKFIKAIKEYNANKQKYLAYKGNELDYMNYDANKEAFSEFMASKESFDEYKKAIGTGKKPFFMMYASDIDHEGNVSFNYDFNPDFITLLRQQGIQGINDIEVLEAYLHLIFSQNYFATLFNNTQKEKEKE